MIQLLRTYGPAFLLAALALMAVMAGVGIAALVSARRRGVRINARAVNAVCLAGSLTVLAVVTMTPQYGGRQVNLTPGAGLTIGPDGRLLAYNILGNAFLFAPLGMFLPGTFGWARSVRKLLVAALLVSVSIEATQYLLALGRIADINDVIVNSAGAVGGWALWRAAVRWSPELVAQ